MIIIRLYGFSEGFSSRTYWFEENGDRTEFGKNCGWTNHLQHFLNTLDRDQIISVTDNGWNQASVVYETKTSETAL